VSVELHPRLVGNQHLLGRCDDAWLHPVWGSSGSGERYGDAALEILRRLLQTSGGPPRED